MKKPQKFQNEKRVLARRIAKVLDTDALKAVAGGGTSCSGGCEDDCCVN